MSTGSIGDDAVEKLADPIAWVETRFGITLRKVGREEWCGPCIFCGGKDRGRYFASGRFWCRPGLGHCGKAGWLDEIDGIDKPSEMDILKWRVERLERQQAEQERRLSVLEQMHRCTDHLTYHANLVEKGEGFDYWNDEGFSWDTITKYKLGYCPSCPTYHASASYTIPVTFRGVLYNIRHRLVTPPPTGGKYRPQVQGIPALIFHADDLDRTDSHEIIIGEGEKKALGIAQCTGRPVIATMGCQAFKPEWATKLAKFQTILVCLDPDATEQAEQIAALFKRRGRVVQLPAKADDFFFKLNGTAEDFGYYLRLARPVTRV